ncbi:MAG: regulatory protein RecX [Gammaproteobacteria bacterium]
MRKRALGFLAGREHSALELSRKLKLKGYEAQYVQPVVAELARAGLQSDDRFTESYVHNRLEKGFGPLRIAMELRERGVRDELIDLYLDRSAQEWLERAGKVRQKRFGRNLPATFRDQARQSRFLQQRGFSGDQIRRIFKSGDE